MLLGGLTFALRAASREMRLSRMKADFVSNVSHELRTPLASIRVFGEFLRLGRVTDAQKTQEYGEYIENESRRLTQLINNILDFSKIESEAKTYELAPTDLGAVMEVTLRTLEVSLKHKGFTLHYDPPSAPIPTLALDGDAIGQAVANLVDNAVKYSERCPNDILGASLEEREGEARDLRPWITGSASRSDEQEKHLRALPSRLDRVGPRREGERPRALDRPSHRAAPTAGSMTRSRASPASGSTFSHPSAATRAAQAEPCGRHPRGTGGFRYERTERARERDRDRGQSLMPRVLIVEDDEAMAVALRDGFAYEGYEVRAGQRRRRRGCASRLGRGATT